MPKSVKRKSAKRTYTKRKSAKRRSVKRNSTKRKSDKRKSVKRKSVKRKSKKTSRPRYKKNTPIVRCLKRASRICRNKSNKNICMIRLRKSCLKKK